VHRHKGPASRGAVLVVDDDRLVREVLTEYLGGAGYDVRAAENAMTALALLDDGYTDLVLLDIEMPGVNGLEALKQIVATHPGLPVVMITAYADLEKTAKALRHGASDYVRKPIDLEYLDRVIRVQISARERAPAAPKPDAEGGSLPPGNQIGSSEDRPV